MGRLPFTSVGAGEGSLRACFVLHETILALVGRISKLFLALVADNQRHLRRKAAVIVQVSAPKIGSISKRLNGFDIATAQSALDGHMEAKQHAAA